MSVAGGSPSPKGPEAYPLLQVSPDHWETLTFLLARDEDPAVVIVRNKDRGLDARLPDHTGRRTLRGWQAKRFETKAVHWGQCEKSLDDAVAFWRPLHVTFVFAHDLSAAEQQSFTTRLVERHPLVRVDFWPAAEIQRRLRDTEAGRRAAVWLFGTGKTVDDVLDAMVSKEPVRTATEVAERQGALSQRLGHDDPHLFYTSVIRQAGAPETPPGAEAVASVVLNTEGEEVRYDLAERYPGALGDLGGGPLLVVTDDEQGIEARRTLARAGSSEGSIRIESGVGVKWPAVPVGLRGLIPEQALLGPVEITTAEMPAVPPEPAPVLPLLARVGDVELGMTFAPADAVQEGFEHTLMAATGGLELLHSLRAGADGGGEGKLDWRHALGVGPALDQLLSCRLVRAVLSGERFQLRIPEDPDAVLDATIGEHPYGEDDLDELARHEEFLELVCEVQRWLGVPLEPPARPTDEDAQQLGRALGLIRKPVRDGTWTEARIVLTGPMEAEVAQVAILEPVFVELFGIRAYLGMDVVVFAAARLAEQDGEHARLVPADEGAALRVALQRPELAPPEAAKPRGMEGGNRVLARALATLVPEPERGE